MFDQSLFNSLVRGQAVLCGTVVDARLVNGFLAVPQSPVSHLSLRPSWQPEADPGADERDYLIAALAVKRAGRSARLAGRLSSRTGHAKGSSQTAVVTTGPTRSTTTSVGKTFSRCRPSWTHRACLLAMMHGRPAGRTPPASIRGRDS